MADVYKRLGSLAPANTDEYILYTSPAGKDTLVSNITVANRSATAQTFDISIYSVAPTITVGYTSPAVNNLYKTATIAANSTEVLEPGIIIPAGGAIVVKNSANLAFNAFGTQVDIPTNYDILGQSVGTGDNYTVSSGKQSLVRSINIANTSSSSSYYDLYAYNSFVDAPTFAAIRVGTTTNVAAVSTNGITWTQTTLPESTYWNTIGYGNNFFVVVPDSASYAARSTDGISWSKVTIPNVTGWKLPLYGNGVLTYVGGSGNLTLRSTDGITWTQGTMPSADFFSASTGVFANNTFIRINSYLSNVAFTSTDGITWTTRTMPSSSSWRSAAYGSGTFVAVAYGTAAAASSTDGITWTARTMPLSSNWTSVAYGNSLFVAISESVGTIAASSTNGITWTQRTLPSSQTWKSLTYGNGLFVATAQDGYAASSTNGITWTARTMPVISNWSSVTYGLRSILDPRDTLAFGVTIGANETHSYKSGFTLSSQEKLRLETSGTNLTMSTFGMEI